ncbi:MAG: phosphotransferase family protein [Pirellulaceae bacterium]
MITLEADSVAEYLSQQGWSPSADSIKAQRLTGGVSNRVILAECDHASPSRIVIKQARPQLEVEQLWECSIERVIREMEVLEVCDRILAKITVPVASEFTAAVPKPVFFDRENYVYAMSAAPAEHEVWKAMLLRGQADVSIAETCGDLLATIHAGSWHCETTAAAFDDVQFFDDLRLDPYYRQIARVHEDLAEPIDSLISSINGNRCCLVHGDFSPKNLLVAGDQLILLDFEVGHFGDPAFDLGFFLTHLVIKSVFIEGRCQDYLSLIQGFLTMYWNRMTESISVEQLTGLQKRAMMNLGACLIARVDGKSPVEYLDDPTTKAAVRSVGWNLLNQPPNGWADLPETIVNTLNH